MSTYHLQWVYIYIRSGNLAIVEYVTLTALTTLLLKFKFHNNKATGLISQPFPHKLSRRRSAVERIADI
jgi:hypothetical protein